MKKFFVCVLLLILTGCAGEPDAIINDGNFPDVSTMNEQSTESGATGTDETTGPEETNEPDTPVAPGESGPPVTPGEPGPSVTSAAIFTPGSWRTFMVREITTRVTEGMRGEVREVTGRIIEDIRVEYGGRIYDLMVAVHDINTEFRGWHYADIDTRVFISERRDGGYYLLQVLEVPGRAGNNFQRVMVISDITFDGRSAVLVKQGRFRMNDYVTYAAFIYTDGVYKLNDSFSEIKNPVIDAENQRILSTGRDGALSHSAAFYAYTNGVFEPTDILTRLPDVRGGGIYPDTWRFEITRFRDGDVTTEIFLQNDLETDEIFAEFIHAEFVHADWWRWPSPVFPPPLTFEQIHTAIMPQIRMGWGDAEYAIISAERVPRETDYFWWDSAADFVILLNSARYRVTYKVREPLEDYLFWAELWGENSPFTRDGDYTILTGYYNIHKIDGVPRLVVVLC